MGGIDCNSAVMATVEMKVSAGITELVRGQDEALLAQFKPLVCSQSITLDLSSVERVDAAGIAALITLYCAARQAGNRFTVTSATPRVAEILALVGLTRLLESQDAKPISQSGSMFELTAA